MYLAEDRVMCLEILTKKEENWHLKYLHGAKALTDVPLNLSTLVKQRRRWINGSLMASWYCIVNFCRIKQSSHSCCYAFLVSLLFLYMILYMLLTVFLVGSFYSAFSIFMRSFYPSDECRSFNHLSNVVENVYLIFLFIILIVSVTRRADEAEFSFLVAAGVLGFFMVVTIIATFYFFFLGDDGKLHKH